MSVAELDATHSKLHPDKPQPDAERLPVRDRVAVVLIHGMGEQTPMETLRGFAKSVWQTDKDVSRVKTSDGRDGSEIFFVPDSRTGSRELRRIGTRTSQDRPPPTGATGAAQPTLRADFYELYWADATVGNSWRDFLSWYWHLLVRQPTDVPRSVSVIWFLLCGLTLCLGVAALVPVFALAPLTGEQPMAWTTAGALLLGLGGLLGVTALGLNAKAPWWLWLAAYVLAGFGALVLACVAADRVRFRNDMLDSEQRPWAALIAALFAAFVVTLKTFLTKVFGDVARYTLVTPGNITARQEIRKRGLTLLKELSASRRYERIIVVGHSLGSVVAYDLITLLWGEFATGNASERPVVRPDSKLAAHLKDLEEIIASKDASKDFDRTSQNHVRDLQRRVFYALAAQSPTSEKAMPWLISDLVTIANPLTHAEFLLAYNRAELQERFERRELATCPPALEFERQGGPLPTRLTYNVKGSSERFLLHDAAFAAVRWSSIHDQPSSRWSFLIGDVISGPVAQQFGHRPHVPKGAATASPAPPVRSAILDIKVEPRRYGGVLPARLFSHTDYWTLPPAGSDLKLTDSVKAVRAAVNLLDTDAAEHTARSMAKR